MSERTIKTSLYVSPCGALLLGSFQNRLCLCDWASSPHHASVVRRVSSHLGATVERAAVCPQNACENAGKAQANDQPKEDALSIAKNYLDAYFSGKTPVTAPPLLLVGTDFQRQVWQKLQEIPRGAVTSYSLVAQLIGKASATRAVASAIGANALSVFIPCHRVIGKGGSLTGYAGGLTAKKALLRLENAVY